MAATFLSTAGGMLRLVYCVSTIWSGKPSCLGRLRAALEFPNLAISCRGLMSAVEPRMLMLVTNNEAALSMT